MVYYGLPVAGARDCHQKPAAITDMMYNNIIIDTQSKLAANKSITVCPQKLPTGVSARGGGQISWTGKYRNGICLCPGFLCPDF